MNVDWAADVKKFVPDADDGAIAGIIRFCGIALQNRDSSLVSFSDPAETDRVRESFLKRKLGLTLPDAELDEAIAAVGKRMSGVNFRNRVTVYYLLADHFARLHQFVRGTPAGEAAAGTESAAGAGGSVLAGAAGVAGAAAAGVAGAAGAGVAAAQGAVSGIAAAAGEAGSAVAGAATGAAAAAVAGASALAAQAAGAGGEARDAALGAVSGAGAAVAGAAQGAASAAADLASGVTGAVGAGVGSAHRMFENAVESGSRRRWGWLPWLLLGLLLVALLLWLFGCQPRSGQAPAGGTEAAGAAMAGSGQEGLPASGVPDAAASGVAAAPALSVPAAAGASAAAVAEPAAAPSAAAAELASRVVTETRDGKPAVKLFFRPGSAWVVPGFAPAAAPLKAYLAEHPGATLAVSGFADKTGNAEVNAAISRERATRVKAALVAAGIPEGSVNLVKPAEAVDGSSTDGAGRRVEVTVQ